MVARHPGGQMADVARPRLGLGVVVFFDAIPGVGCAVDLCCEPDARPGAHGLVGTVSLLYVGGSPLFALEIARVDASPMDA